MPILDIVFTEVLQLQKHDASRKEGHGFHSCE